MGRTPRIEFPGAVYHITSRGNERKNIFRDKYDFFKFLEILEDYHERFGIVVYCYVLMNNHYHLLMETPYGDLQKVMHGINNAYTHYFNYRYERIGHLFQGRYKSIVVEKDTYLLQLSRYIHLNPVRAQMVERPEDYRWSSYRGFIGKDRLANWVDRKSILSLISNDQAKALAQYIHFVNAIYAREEENPLSYAHEGVALGSKDFVEKVENIREGQRERESERIDAINFVKDKCLEPEKIFKVVAEYFNVDTIMLKDSAVASQRGFLPRKTAIFTLKKFTGLSNAEIGRICGGINSGAVSQICTRFRKKLSHDQSLSKIIETIGSQLDVEP